MLDPVVNRVWIDNKVERPVVRIKGSDQYSRPFFAMGERIK